MFPWPSYSSFLLYVLIDRSVVFCYLLFINTALKTADTSSKREMYFDEVTKVPIFSTRQSKGHATVRTHSPPEPGTESRILDSKILSSQQKSLKPTGKMHVSSTCTGWSTHFPVSSSGRGLNCRFKSSNTPDNS